MILPVLFRFPAVEFRYLLKRPAALFLLFEIAAVLQGLKTKNRRKELQRGEPLPIPSLPPRLLIAGKGWEGFKGETGG